MILYYILISNKSCSKLICKISLVSILNLKKYNKIKYFIKISSWKIIHEGVGKFDTNKKYTTKQKNKVQFYVCVRS